MVILADTPNGMAQCAALMAPLSEPERLSLAGNAISAGGHVRWLSSAMGLDARGQPTCWALETLAADGPSLARAIKQGMSYDQLIMAHGPLDCAPAIHRVQFLFTTTWAADQVRSGQPCDQKLKQWSRKLTIFEHPNDLRLVAFRDDAEALSAYEVQHGIASEPERIDFWRMWETGLGQAINDACAGVLVGQIMVEHGLDGTFRHRLEVDSCHGAAGRAVFSGMLMPEQALRTYQLLPDGSAPKY